MRPTITGVFHDTSGPTIRNNDHGQGELITLLWLVGANSRPRWRFEVERDSCRRNFLKSDTRQVC
jgi:hypothetical protein